MLLAYTSRSTDRSHRNLAFLLTSGPADQAKNWAALPADQRATLKQQYNAAGVSLVVSAFGETEHPTSQDPTTVANNLAQFVLNTNLDGIDIDYEEFELVTAQSGVGEAWLTTLTQVLRKQLPQGQFILSHARECYRWGYEVADELTGMIYSCWSLVLAWLLPWGLLPHG